LLPLKASGPTAKGLKTRRHRSWHVRPCHMKSALFSGTREPSTRTIRGRAPDDPRLIGTRPKRSCAIATAGKRRSSHGDLKVRRPRRSTLITHSTAACDDDYPALKGGGHQCSVHTWSALAFAAELHFRLCALTRAHKRCVRFLDLRCLTKRVQHLGWDGVKWRARSEGVSARERPLSGSELIAPA
jgi:hypothetical protein